MSVPENEQLPLDFVDHPKSIGDVGVGDMVLCSYACTERSSEQPYESLDGPLWCRVTGTGSERYEHKTWLGRPARGSIPFLMSGRFRMHHTFPISRIAGPVLEALRATVKEGA